MLSYQYIRIRLQLSLLHQYYHQNHLKLLLYIKMKICSLGNRMMMKERKLSTTRKENMLFIFNSRWLLLNNKNLNLLILILGGGEVEVSSLINRVKLRSLSPLFSSQKYLIMHLDTKEDLRTNLITLKAILCNHLLNMANYQQVLCHWAIIWPHNPNLTSLNLLSRFNPTYQLSQIQSIRALKDRSKKTTEKILRCKSNKERSRSNKNNSKKSR